MSSSSSHKRQATTTHDKIDFGKSLALGGACACEKLALRKTGRSVQGYLIIPILLFSVVAERCLCKRKLCVTPTRMQASLNKPSDVLVVRTSCPRDSHVHFRALSLRSTVLAQCQDQLHCVCCLS